MKKLLILAITAALLLTACSPAVSETPTEQTQTDAADAAASASPEETKETWKVAFEKSLLENYGVTPEYYEDLGNGVYQVYVRIDGKIVPYVAVDSATGDYHG